VEFWIEYFYHFGLKGKKRASSTFTFTFLLKGHEEGVPSSLSLSCALQRCEVDQSLFTFLTWMQRPSLRLLLPHRKEQFPLLSSSHLSVLCSEMLLLNLMLCDSQFVTRKLSAMIRDPAACTCALERVPFGWKEDVVAFLNQEIFLLGATLSQYQN
jgi:hypothetical protein